MPFHAARPFWYTTPSKASAVAGSTVDFGIVYPAAELTEYVLSDAALGLPDIGLLVKGPQGEFTLTTDQAGKFVVPVAQPSEYVAHINDETVPDGYALDDLKPDSVLVAQGEFEQMSFTRRQSGD
jgi:hypothetical protein